MKFKEESRQKPAITLVAVVIVALGFISCAPEQHTEVYSKSVAGIEMSQQWSNEKVRAVIPKGWVPEPVFGMRDASFRVIGPSASEGEIAISRLPIEGGTLLSNVNRWRKQAGLDELQKDISTVHPKVEVAGYDGWLIDLPAASPEYMTILGVVLEIPKERIFIKFTGEESIVSSGKEAFTEFINSLEFGHEG